MRRIVTGLLMLVLVSPVPAQRRYGGRPAPGGAKPGAIADVLVQLEGTLRSISKKEIILDLPNDQSLTLRRGKKVAFFRGKEAVAEPKIAQGTALAVEVRKNPWGEMEAVNVYLGR